MKTHRIQLLLLILTSLTWGACHKIYLENPMPRAGKEVQTFPAEWLGLYEQVSNSAEEHDDPFGELLAKCYRVEALENSQVLVSQEFRLKKDKRADFQKWLEDARAKGDIGEYVFSDYYLLMKNVAVRDSAGNVMTYESQYIRLNRDKNWYIFESSATPLYLYDFAQKTARSFDTNPNSPLKNEFAFDADTLSERVRPLVAKSTDKRICLNFKEEEKGLWDWMHVRAPRPGQLILQTADIQDGKKLAQRMDKLNKITPFAQLTNGNDYKIDPTDAAFERLLEEEGVFTTIVLKKIE